MAQSHTIERRSNPPASVEELASAVGIISTFTLPQFGQLIAD